MNKMDRTGKLFGHSKFSIGHHKITAWECALQRAKMAQLVGSTIIAEDQHGTPHFELGDVLIIRQ